jgi:hypothetical protein
MGTPAIARLALLLQSESEDSRVDSALTLAHMRTAEAVDLLIAAARGGILDRRHVDPLLECATGWRGVGDWSAWWDEHRLGWRFLGIQADHYVMRIHPPIPADVPRAIEQALAAKGHILGNATVDFHVDAGADDDTLLQLGLQHTLDRCLRVDRRRSTVCDLGDYLPGKMLALFFLRPRE